MGSPSTTCAPCHSTLDSRAYYVLATFALAIYLVRWREVRGSCRWAGLAFASVPVLVSSQAVNVVSWVQLAGVLTGGVLLWHREHQHGLVHLLWVVRALVSWKVGGGYAPGTSPLSSWALSGASTPLSWAPVLSSCVVLHIRSRSCRRLSMWTCLAHLSTREGEEGGWFGRLLTWGLSLPSLW